LAFGAFGEFGAFEEFKEGFGINCFYSNLHKN